MITMRMQGVAQSHSRTDVAIRGLEGIIDEPVERGGTNLGMSPTETFVASLVGCTNVISHKTAHKNGIELSGMNFLVDAARNQLPGDTCRVMQMDIRLAPLEAA